MKNQPNNKGRLHIKDFASSLRITGLCALIGACSPKGSGTGTVSGSELQGRYNPKSVLSNPQTPACWASEAEADKAGANNGLAPARWSFLKPVIESKIKEQIVQKTNGVLNPFPLQLAAALKPESDAGLPTCGSENGSRIKMYLADFSSYETKLAAENNAPAKPGVAGIYYQDCERIERLPAQGVTAKPVLVAGDGSLNIQAVPASAESQRRCIVVFAGFINHLVSQNAEVLKAYVAATALHELLHAYGLDEEHLHTKNMENILAGRPDANTCDPFRSFGVNRELANSSGKDFGGYDPESIMNYCFSNESSLDKVKLSEGDVKLLNFLYASASSSNATNNTLPSKAPPLQSPGTETSTLPSQPKASPNPLPQDPDSGLPGTEEVFGSLNCENKQAANFSTSWQTHYLLTGSVARGYKVRVTATRVGETSQAKSSWGEHPVQAASGPDSGNHKFLTYTEGKSRFLVHRPNLERPNEFISVKLECTTSN